MCSISGYNGKKKPNYYFLKILSLFGSLRGEDSFGVVQNNERIIYTKKGVGYNSTDYGSSLVSQQIHQYPSKNKILKTNNVLQHNRKKSSGVITQDAAHPYEYEYVNAEGEPHTFFFMHNGTLKDVYNLALDHGFRFIDFETDSHLLGQIILEQGFDVLKKYEGAAACAFYWSEFPEKLFLWKGAEEITYWNKTKGKHETYVDSERPLHYVKTSNGVYFASLEGYLMGLGFKATDVEEALPNCITVFNNGEVEDVIKIDRIKYKKEEEKKKKEAAKKAKKEQKAKNKNFSIVKTNSDSNLFKEWTSYYARRTVIYYFNGKYYKDEKVLNGKYNVDLFGNTGSNVFLGKNLYFYRGLWLKDADAYNKCIISGVDYVQRELLHPECVWISELNNRKTYNQGEFVVRSKFFRPRFSCFYLLIDSSGHLKYCQTVGRAVVSGNLNEEEYFIEAFNEVYVSDQTRDCITFDDIVSYVNGYMTVDIEDINFEELFTADNPFFNASSKYDAFDWESTLNKLKLQEKQSSLIFN